MLHQEHVQAVRAVLDQGRYSWIWVIPVCPYCGLSHDHYGGPLDGRPRYATHIFTAPCAVSDHHQPMTTAATAMRRYKLVGDASAHQ